MIITIICCSENIWILLLLAYRLLVIHWNGEWYLNYFHKMNINNIFIFFSHHCDGKNLNIFYTINIL